MSEFCLRWPYLKKNTSKDRMGMIKVNRIFQDFFSNSFIRLKFGSFIAFRHYRSIAEIILTSKFNRSSNGMAAFGTI